MDQIFDDNEIEPGVRAVLYTLNINELIVDPLNGPYVNEICRVLLSYPPGWQDINRIRKILSIQKWELPAINTGRVITLPLQNHG